MSGMKRNVVLALAVAATVAAPGAFATNGYFSHGYGTKNKALAGAGVALPQDAMQAATNPAGMVFVGNRMDLGAALFSPSPRKYTASGGSGAAAINDGGTSVSQESDNDFFLIPHFARNWMLDSDSAFGLTIYGNGGMNTEWKGSDTPFGLGPYFGASAGGEATAGVDLMQLFINLTYARKISSTSSWGVSGIIAHQRFKATGLAAFGGSVADGNPDNLTDNGYDTSNGAGIKIGWQGDVAPGVTLGASYQSEMMMSEFDKYSDLFAEQGDFDIPATATIGLAWKTSPSTTLVADVQKIMYSKIKSIGNRFDKFMTCAGPGSATCLGGSDGVGFGWEDMTVFKLGYQWQSNPGMTWRAGYSKGDQPIGSSEVLFNVLAPGVIEQHVTFGFTSQMDKSSELNFAATYAPNKKVSGSPFTNPTQTIELQMKQYDIELSWAKKF